MPGRFKRWKPTTFMAMAAQMWPRPDQPIVYGSVEINMCKALDYIKLYSEKHQAHVTVTHLVIAILSRYLKKYPESNLKCEAGKFYQRQDIDIFLPVSIPDREEDLSGVMLRNCDQMSLADIAARLGRKATEVKHGRDETYRKSRSFFARYPPWVTKIILKFADFYVNRMNRDLSGQGMPKDPCGSAMVTSVGMFGVEEGYGPIVPLSRIPIFLVVTEVRDRPWVEDGKIVIRPILKIMATLDHRLMDGFKGGQLSAELKRIQDPEKVFGLEEKIPVGLRTEAEEPVRPFSCTGVEGY